MKRFLRRTLYCLAPATVAALVLGVPMATPDVSSQPVTIACSVDSPFTLAADSTTLTQLTLALAAMIDPTCAITETAPTAAPAGTGTYAVGGGLTNLGTRFSFSAHLNTANPPSGYVHVIAPQNGLDLQGHVTCLAVQGQAAVVGFEIEKGTGQGASQGAAFLVQDNGSPGTSGDIFGGPLLIAIPPTNCNSSVGFLPQSVIQGNIVVK